MVLTRIDATAIGRSRKEKRRTPGSSARRSGVRGVRSTLARRPTLVANCPTQRVALRSRLALSISRSASGSNRRRLLGACSMLRPERARLLTRGHQPGLAEVLTDRATVGRSAARTRKLLCGSRASRRLKASTAGKMGPLARGAGFAGTTTTETPQNCNPSGNCCASCTWRGRSWERTCCEKRSSPWDRPRPRASCACAASRRGGSNACWTTASSCTLMRRQ